MQTHNNNSERRSAKRHNVLLSVETDKGAGVTRDFSLSGLYLMTKSRLALGDTLRLRVALPDPEQANVHWFACSGQVVRVQDEGDAVGLGIAIHEEGLLPLHAA